MLIELDDGSEPAEPTDAPDGSTADVVPAPKPTDVVEPGGGVPGRVKAAPSTRKLARDLDVDLNALTGSGPGGRIAAEDVRAASAPAGTAADSADHARPAGDLGRMSPGRHPLRGVRGVVARNMARSWSEVPHIHSMDEIDASMLVDFRRRLRGMDRPGASSVTPLTIAAAAAARALRLFPMVNACIEGSPGESIIVHGSVNLGIAVATDSGLVVPVVRDADLLDLFDLAGAIADLASRGRDGTLTAADLAGGTFTITNYGSLGGRWATPLIVPGQAAILGLGAIADRPLVVDGEVVARPTLPIVLGTDHRLIDGDLSSAFRRAITEDLLEPLRLLVGG